MRRILAIASIGIRNAVRSRVVICLLFLLAVAVVGLPLSLKGDGTAEGQLRIIITYSLGAAFMLLALSTLWAGALSIAQEVEYQQIQLLASKPVHPAEIWFGKWLGLMAVNAVLLLAAAGATAILLPREFLDSQSRDGAAWRAVFRPVAPDAPDRADAARALLDARIRAGEIPADVPRQAALRKLQQELLVRAATVAPGRRANWTFALPRAIRPDETIRIRFRASSSHLSLASVRGRWIAGNPERDSAWLQESVFIPNTYQTIAVPGAALAGSQVLNLSFVNEDPAHATLVFDPQDGVRVLLPSGDFYLNYARALVMLLMRLGFLAALGVTAGALFSSPVALFMAIASLAAAQLAGYTAEFHSASGGILVVMDRIGDILRFALRPLAAPSALDAVATGMRVETAWLIRVLGIQMLAYGGALAALGAGVMARRELALPPT